MNLSLSHTHTHTHIARKDMHPEIKIKIFQQLVTHSIVFLC
jgi:hypothetical protein